jgi:predicted RNase H-like nuclease (RuvC/YqgF family)
MANELENATNTNQEAKPVDTAELDKRIKALEAENAKLKQSVTNASADASKYKKELQAKQTDEEKARAEQEAATAAMKQELETLRNERNVANHKAELTNIGFDGDLAQATAEAINAGDTAKLFDGIRKFIASHDKELQAKALLANPVLNGGNSEKKTVSREEFNNMGYREMVNFKTEHPDMYEEYTKKT